MTAIHAKPSVSDHSIPAQLISHLCARSFHPATVILSVAKQPMFYPQILPVFLALCFIPSFCLGSPSLITAAPDLLRRQQPGQDSPSCAGWYSVENSCSSLTPNFSKQPLLSHLNCVCYTSSTWAGSVYDSYLDSCLAYLSTASPSIYTLLGITGSLTTPCEDFSPAATSNAAACLKWGSIEASCSVETSSLGVLPFSSQASCLCYASSTYAPSVFDGAWDGCLSYYSTASPQYYSSISGDQADRTPCAKEGNVANGPTAVTAVTSPLNSNSVRPLTTAEPWSTSTSVNGVATWKRDSLAGAVFVAMAISMFLF